MPTSTPLPDDERQDETLNPGQQAYDRNFNRLKQAEENVSNNTGAEDVKNPDTGSVDPSSDLLNNEASSLPYKGWINNTNTPIKSVTKVWWKSKGAVAGGAGGVGIIGIIMALLGFGGASMPLLNIAENGVIQNDARSTILERRLVQALNQKMGNNGACTSAKMRCNMGRIPVAMLSAMEKKGITPLDKEGKRIPIEGTGYLDPDKAPTHYSYTDSKGGVKVIDSAAFMTTYKNDPVFRKMFKSAYNMRYLGYNGRYMATNFFKKFGLKRDGGAATDPNFKEGTAGEKVSELLKSEGDNRTGEGVKRTFKDRASSLFNRSANKVKRTNGDPIIAAGTVGCMVINMPRFVAGAYRAVELARLLVLLNEVILSPAGMQKAGKASESNIAAVGKLLTERPIDTNGKQGKSALDSDILQSAIGVNKNKVKVSKFTPGYSLLTNPVIKASSSLSDSTKQTCNLINSPQAAIVSAGVTAAVGAATGGIGAIIKGVIQAAGKAALAIGVVDGIIKGIEATGVIEKLAVLAYDQFADHIPNIVEGARFVDLGDALGTAMLAFFSQSGSLTGAAPLTLDQANAFKGEMASVNEEYRQEAIATLSPFDTSSQYTFLGSIASRMSLVAAGNNPLYSSFAVIGNILKSPLSTLSSSVGAADKIDATCGYASEFDLEEDVAVNAAGYPCVGIPTEYINMPRETVYDLVEDDVDEDTGEIKEDGDIAVMLADCADGDLEAISGCTIKSVESVSGPAEFCSIDEATGEQTCARRNISVEGTDEAKRAAQSIYLYDLQVEKILAGEDTEDEAVPSPSTPGEVSVGRPENVENQNKGWTLKEGVDYSAAACAPGTEDAGTYHHPTEGFTIRKCKYKGILVNALVSDAVVKLDQAAKDQQIQLIMGNSFRSYEEQEQLYQQNCRNGVCHPPTAKPGNSQHERGLAIDFSWGNCKTRSTACYQWLSKNAAAFGYYNLESEPWHWSVSGY